MDTKISIITISYNSEKTIAATIESVLAQKYTNLEYIIIDGASTDNTLNIINNYSCEVLRVVSELDNGIADAFNKGITLATGELVGLINSDDLLCDGALNAINEAYKHQKHDVIYGNSIIVDSTNNLKFIKKAQPIEKIKYELPFIHQSCFISKSAYEKFGGYSSEYKICMDYALIAKMYQGGCDFLYIDKEISVFAYGGTSCKHPFRTINEDLKIAVSYGLNRKEAFKYKARLYLKNIVKIFCQKIGLWERLYKVINKDKIQY